jgi:hypothetical protein
MSQDSPTYGGGRPSGYSRKWPKWLAIYAVVAAVLYLIVYFVLFHHGSGYGGSSGGGMGGGGGGYAFIPLPAFFLRSLTRRARSG